MSVVLRCPTCGTTQGHPGECEACSEGHVRYFCTNHEQGIWLDGPVCTHCGSRFGDASRTPRTPPPPRAPTRPGGPPDFRPPARRRIPEPRPEPDVGRRPPTRPEPDEPVEPEVLPRTPSLGELLEEITRGGARRYEAEVPWPEPPVRRTGFPIAGCLVRTLGLLFLLIVAAIVFLFLLFGGFIVN